jgi:hypothetical protein
MNISFKNFFTDKHGKVVLWQSPSLPLWSWLAFMLLSKIVSSSGLHTVFKYISLASLVVWALLEITKGASYFRRLLGIIVLVWTLFPR